MSRSNNMPREKWFEIKHPGDYRELSGQYGVSPAMARLLVNRLSGSAGSAPPTAAAVRSYLYPDSSLLYSHKGLPDMDKAVDILSDMIRDKKKIRVIGDYDIDGVCSTYILTSGLKKAGAAADHAIPHRITDGYGLNERLIREAADVGIDCIITCDNGISAASQAALAHELGMKIIITDHHEVPYHLSDKRKCEDLPPADAVVDPKREASACEYSEICGAVVAFKVLTALYEGLGMPVSAAEEYEELAAFATIGDVMPLTGENRAIVYHGLEKLRHTGNPGMQALIRAQGIDGERIQPYHVGFVLGPCINATGRLATADNAFGLLGARDASEAERLAGMLVAMNNDRKEMTERGVAKAMKIAGEERMKEARVLVIYLPDAHESIAGIIAGRVREQTGKPVFVLTPGETGIKGSGRSIEEYDMHEAMTEVSELFSKYGGHKMAGGLSLAEGVTPQMLGDRLNKICTLTEEDLAVKVHFDMQLPFSHADMSLAEDISRLEPFGVGSPRPLFAAKNVRIRNINIYGKSRNVLKCIAEDEYGTPASAIYFGEADKLAGHAGAHGCLKILYCPEINEYRGDRTLQLHIQNYC